MRIQTLNIQNIISDLNNNYEQQTSTITEFDRNIFRV
jgi:hypothetical protein